MLIAYARSSSLNQLDYCEQSYFMTYNLGLQQEPNPKTVMGTAAHKVLECLAAFKKYSQDNPTAETLTINDDALGELSVSKSELYAESQLSMREISQINLSRASKEIYRYDVQLPEIHNRVGQEYVNHLINLSSEYYESRCVTRWTKSQFKDVNNFVWIPLEFDNREFNPLFRKIIFPEQNFNIPIEEDWAKYRYEINGEIIEGTFAIKGTIDLITEIEDGVLETVDWKTGKRYNWGAGTVKDYAALKKDPQLQLYFYALSKLHGHNYPDISFVIYFIRDGGPFAIDFDESHIGGMEDILRKHFLYVKSNYRPKMLDSNQRDFRCNKLCTFYKKNWPGTDKNMCRFIHDKVETIGLKKTIELYKNPDFVLEKYQSPGE